MPLGTLDSTVTSLPELSVTFGSSHDIGYDVAPPKELVVIFGGHCSSGGVVSAALEHSGKMILSCY